MLFDRIKNVATEKGITIKDLEARANQPYNSVHRWRNIQPSIDKVKAVADILGVSVDYLLANEFYENFKQLREANGKTPVEVAEDLGINVERVERYENGTEIPTGRELKRVADYFNVSEEYITGEVGKNNDIEKQVRKLSNMEGARTLFSMIENMSESDFQKTIQIVRLITQKDMDDNC